MGLIRIAGRFRTQTTLRPYSNSANQSSQSPLRGRSAIITGGSRGIGRAIAKILAQNGAECLLVGRDPSTLAATAADIKSALNDGAPNIVFASADVTHRDIWSELFSGRSGGLHDAAGTWVEENPHPHILVNAAGITQNSLLLRTDPAVGESILDVNLTGTIRACREVGRRMVRRKDVKQQTGCIINIASLLATHGGRGSSIYAASKAGMLGLTRSLAAELGPMGVRVNAIAPGWIDTDMTNGMSDSSKAELSAKIPLGRFGTADEVANTALFLALNGYANNCHIGLDGGLSAEM